jgi:hypothetical protein
MLSEITVINELIVEAFDPPISTMYDIYAKLD